MPKNVMKLVKPSPHRARNAFDLSHRSVFSQNFGELLPSMCVETVPGDHIEVSLANLVRAIPMVTSPFLRAKQHVDIWFVPYRDLWHQFDNFITQKVEPVSSALKQFTYLPHTDIYTLYDQGVQGGITDIIGRAQNIGAAKLLNLLGYANSSHASSTNPHKVNLFRLAAYNYIWYNEYRQQYYDDGMHLQNTNLNPSYLFNFDFLTCDTLTSADPSTYLNSAYVTDYFSAMCQMRYRCWKKDLFTGLMPATQFGNVSTFGNLQNVRLQFVDSTGNDLKNRVMSVGTTGGSSVSDPVTANNIPATSWNVEAAYLKSGTLSVDVLALRKSEAVQIWRENALRAGNHVKDNMLAHYGVSSDFQDHRPSYLGSVDAPLNIGDVVATANSDYSGNTNPNTNVGDIAGKGLSSISDNRFKFDAKDFGVIIAISSILPEAEYNAYGIDRMNQLLESEDFFVPEYENLGLEAVGSQTFVNTPSSVAKVIGYAPRYYGYKTKLDKCFGSFMTGGMFAPWCSPKSDVATVLGTPPSALPLSVLYVNPALYDVNFSVSISNSDEFLNDSYYEVDAVRPMSVLGMPFS